MLRLAARLLLAGFLLGPAAAVRAGDGCVEINLAAALAGGITLGDAAGFPVELNDSGSYVLTGDLSVPAALPGIVIDADDVTLDLGGFALRGPATCTASSCPSSAVTGIASGLSSGTVVENGSVSGFGGNCIQLGPSARVEKIGLRACGSAGLSVGEGSLVLDSSRQLRDGGERARSPVRLRSSWAHRPAATCARTAAVRVRRSGATT